MGGCSRVELQDADMKAWEGVEGVLHAVWVELISTGRRPRGGERRAGLPPACHRVIDFVLNPFHFAWFRWRSCRYDLRSRLNLQGREPLGGWDWASRIR